MASTTEAQKKQSAAITRNKIIVLKQGDITLKTAEIWGKPVLSCFSSCFIDYAKAFVWITTNCKKFLKRWEQQTTLPASWETSMQVKKKQFESHMEQSGIKIAGRNINNLKCADDTIFMAESEEQKSPLMKVKEESEKAGLKLNIHKMRIMASGPITSWKIEENNGNSDRLYSFGFKITADGDCSHEIKRCLLFVRKAMKNLAY